VPRSSPPPWQNWHILVWQVLCHILRACLLQPNLPRRSPFLPHAHTYLPPATFPTYLHVHYAAHYGLASSHSCHGVIYTAWIACYPLLPLRASRNKTVRMGSRLSAIRGSGGSAGCCLARTPTCAARLTRTSCLRAALAYARRTPLLRTRCPPSPACQQAFRRARGRASCRSGHAAPPLAWPFYHPASTPPLQHPPNLLLAPPFCWGFTHFARCVATRLYLPTHHLPAPHAGEERIRAVSKGRRNLPAP